MDVHLILGNALRSKNDSNGAIMEYDEAIRLQPDSPTLHYNLAVTFEGMGEEDRARREYETYLKLDPTAADSEATRKHLSDLESSRGKK